MRSQSVTAILPNYNYASYLRSRVQEVLEQSYPVSEIIILDDASTDGSKAIIQEIASELQHSYPNLKVKIEFNQKNSGNVFAQWQKGIKLATSDLIWICELDDSTSPDFLYTMVSSFKDDSVVLSYCSSKVIGKNNQLVFKDNLRRVKDLFRRRHFPGGYTVSGIEELNRNLAVFNSIPNVSATVFKNLPELNKILDHAKSFDLSGDWYFYVELAKLGKIAYNPQALSKHRLHSGSVSGKTSFNKRLDEIRKIHQHIIDTTTLTKTAIKRMKQMEQILSEKWGSREK